MPMLRYRLKKCRQALLPGAVSKNQSAVIAVERNARVLQQSLPGTDRKHGFAMPELIPDEFKG